MADQRILITMTSAGPVRMPLDCGNVSSMIRAPTNIITPWEQVLEPVRIFYFLQLPKSLFLSIPKVLQALNRKEICRNQALEPQTNEFIWNLTLAPVLSSMFLYSYLTAEGPFE